jgi:predicted Rossmann fold flavoprotein
VNRADSSCDVIVIGGGGAGMMCAIEAGRRGRRVVLLEHNDRVGRKIAISGGGRCNFTNLGAGPENFLSTQPDFCKSALARYTPVDFIALVEKHHVPFHEKTLGQQFCDTGSQAIIDLLLAECAAANVHIRVNCRVSAVEKPDRFHVATNQGPMDSASLVIATGGLSFAKLGASDFGYRVARQFGLHITELRPGLVPLTFAPQDRGWHELSGISLPVIAHHRGQAFRENLLFTHRGVSGPAVLQISSYWREGETIYFDLLPGMNGDWASATHHASADLSSVLSRHLPRRFAEAWAARHAPSKPLAQVSARELDNLVRLVRAWPVSFAATEGYPKAEVTLGGVDTAGLSSKTMEAHGVPGLFFIGEVVDVTGWLGGYNFQWAWASGHAAGQYA